MQTKDISVTCASVALLFGIANSAPLEVSFQSKLVAADPSTGSLFGQSVALTDGRAVVGAPLDSEIGPASGAAYVYDGTGVQTAKLTASDGHGGQRFAESVAVSGELILAGAPGDNQNGVLAGAAYLIDNFGTETKYTGSDTAPLDEFGRSVALNGREALVGAAGDDDNGAGSGSAYFFDAVGNETKVTAFDGSSFDIFGEAVALTDDRALIGAWKNNDGPDESLGAAYLLDEANNQTKLTASERREGDDFGFSVALSGDTALIGSRGDNDGFGQATGSAYLFDELGNELKLTASDRAAFDQFGYSVALNQHYAVVGARRDDNENGANAGAVYVFDVVTGEQLAKLIAPDGKPGDEFGFSVAIFANTILVGAWMGDSAVVDSGAAYLFQIPQANPVPLPAAAPLMLAGLGALGLRRRRKAA